MSFAHKIWQEFCSLIKIFALLMVVLTFGIQHSKVPSGSMTPTVCTGDYLLINKFTYGFSRFNIPFIGAYLPSIGEKKYFAFDTPKRSHVVTFSAPKAYKGTEFIKRIIGLPGDTIQLIDGIVHINGKAATYKKIKAHTHHEQHRSFEGFLYEETLPSGEKHTIFKTETFGTMPQDNTEAVKIPLQHYFAMGDNRDHSQDSRFESVGCIPYEHITGRALLIFFSMENSPLAFWRLWSEARFQRIGQAVK